MRLFAVCAAVILAGCSTMDYTAYAEAQVKISRDDVVKEAVYMQTLLEMSKSSDATVRAVAVMKLQQWQDRKRVTLLPPGQVPPSQSVQHVQQRPASGLFFPMSRDAMIYDTSYFQNLVEMSKSGDSTIRALGTMQLQQLHERRRAIHSSQQSPTQ